MPLRLLLILSALAWFAPRAEAWVAITPLPPHGVSRWLSEDPIREEGGINLYGYVGNGPTDRFDRYGLHWVDDYVLRPIEAGGNWLWKKITGRSAQRDIETACDFVTPFPFPEENDTNEAADGNYGPLALAMLPGGLGKIGKKLKGLAKCEKASDSEKKLSRTRRISEKGRTQQATEIKKAQEAARKQGKADDIYSTKRAEQEERAAWKRGEYE